jgi:hypothetical protein
MQNEETRWFPFFILHSSFFISPMTFAEMQQAGRELTPDLMKAQLRTLAQDPRFPAVVALVDRNLDSWQTSFAGQPIAESHGKLAHAAGSLHALLILRGQLAACLTTRSKSATPADQGE